MKTLFNNSKTFIKFALTIMAVAILLGTIFVVGFGFNASSEFGKVYELSIDCFDENSLNDYTKSAKEVLKQHGYSATEIFVEDRSYCETLVVRYKSSSQANAEKIEKDIETKLELNENLVSIASLKYSSEKVPAIKLLIAMGVIVVVLFTYGLIRHTWKFALSLVSNFTLNILLSLALIAITRVELSLTALGIVALMATLSTAIFMAIFARMEAVSKQQEKPESFKNNYIEYLNVNKFSAIIPTALLLLVAACFIFTFNMALINIGIVVIITLVVGAFMSIMLAPALLIALQEGRKK